MREPWKHELSCALHCFRCNARLGSKDSRILSVYDHRVICMTCKKSEETRPDYPEVSMQMAEQCLIHAESGVGDPHSYCYHHFYPFHYE